MATMPILLRPLKLLRNEDLNYLLKKQHRGFLIKFLTDYEIEELWSIVWDEFKKHVDSLMSAASADEPQDDEHGEKQTTDEDFVMSVLHLARQTLVVKNDPYVPGSLTDLLLALQGFLCNPAVPDNIQNETAKLYVHLYKNEFLQPAECVTLLQYYLNCALTEKIRAKRRTDIHKLWELRSLLTKINVRSDALKPLKNLLQRCIASKKFLICEDGQQILKTLLEADDLQLQDFILLMKKNMPTMDKKVAVVYGKLLVHAWCKGSGDQKKCIEDYVNSLYNDVAKLQVTGTKMCQLGKSIFRILEMFHTGEAPLLFKRTIALRCIPTHYGYLKSHVNMWRRNACELFFKMYPLTMYFTKDKECMFLDKQHTLVEDLLRDKCHIVCILAIRGTYRIIAENTGTIPHETVIKWLAIIVEELSRDSKSYLVRCCVSKGFRKLLASNLPNTLLESLLAKMKHLYGDVSIQVREAYSELLLKALERNACPKTGKQRPDEGIRWWIILSPKLLLMQIELDDCSTRKWQATLLFRCFILECKPGIGIVKRIASLAAVNPVGTKKLFIIVANKLSFEQVVEIMSAIILMINKYVERYRSQMYKTLAVEEQKVGSTKKTKKEQMKLDKENVFYDDIPVTSEGSRNEEHKSSFLDRPAVMQTLLNVASVLWRTFMKAFEEHPRELHDLHRICQAFLPKFLSFFKGTVVFDCLLLLMTHLPTDLISKMSGLQVSVMSQLKQLPSDVPDATAKSFLVPLVLWGSGRDILELIQDWFNEAFRHCRLNRTVTSMGRRKKVCVISIVPAKPLLAVRFLSIMYQHPMCWDKLLAKCHRQLKGFWMSLERVKTLIVQRLENGQPLENEMLSDDFIRMSLQLYLKLIPFLGNVNRNRQKFDMFINYSEAVQFALGNMVPHIPETASLAQRQEHCLVVNLLNDVLDIGCRPLLLVQPSIKYIQDMHLLASTLLKTGCGSLFAVFSLYLLANLAVYLKGEVAQLDRKLLVSLHSNCVLQFSYLVLASIPAMPHQDLQHCVQEQEVFKNVMTNVLGSSKLFYNNKSLLRLYLAYVDAVVGLVNRDRDQVVPAVLRKNLKGLPFAVAKMISEVLVLNDNAQMFHKALMYRFKQPYEDQGLLLSALKLLSVIVCDVRWTTRMLKELLFVAEEAVSAMSSALGEDFKREASTIVAEIHVRLKRPRSVSSSQRENPGYLPSQHQSQEKLDLNVVQSPSGPLRV